MDKKDFIIWTSKLQDNYVPSKEVLNKISRIDLLAFVGPTGVGKSTLIEASGIHSVLSDVSREKRPKERNNIDYHFRDDYMNMINEIKQGNYVQFLVNNVGEFYGTHINSYPEEGLCAMAVYSSEIPRFKKLGFRSIKQLYIMPPSYLEWMHRIGSDRKEDLLDRIGEANYSLLNALNDESFKFILNDTIENALVDIQSVVNNQPIDEHREMLARGTADTILGRLGSDEEV